MGARRRRASRRLSELSPSDARLLRGPHLGRRRTCRGGLHDDRRVRLARRDPAHRRRSTGRPGRRHTHQGHGSPAQMDEASASHRRDARRRVAHRARTERPIRRPWSLGRTFTRIFRQIAEGGRLFRRVRAARRGRTELPRRARTLRGTVRAASPSDTAASGARRSRTPPPGELGRRRGARTRARGALRAWPTSSPHASTSPSKRRPALSVAPLESARSWPLEGFSPRSSGSFERFGRRRARVPC